MTSPAVMPCPAAGLSSADSVTTLSSFSDPRNAMPQRPGHVIKRVRYGYSSTQNFVLPGGNLLLVIGDVAGHGTSAARTMGKIRYSAR